MTPDDVQALSDADLVLLQDWVAFERRVRNKVWWLTSTKCKRGTLWGPGPPYYTIPRCRLDDGHLGDCEPDKTKAECLAIWNADHTALWDEEHALNREVEWRLSVGDMGT